CKDLRRSCAVNRVYRVLKWQLASARRELLAREAREVLYNRLQEEVPALIERAGLTAQGRWNWTPFEEVISREFQRLQGEPVTQAQRKQLHASLQMRMD